ncbi:MAG: PIN domain-containing protein [Chloroflexi bacterium]|nr:PIN domain-containing protein [Chloroflexota bacterium]
MITVFLDTSAIFAAARPRSDRHAEAKSAYQQLMRDSVRLVTTDLIVVELHALALRRSHPAAALDLVDRLMQSGRIEVLAAGLDRLIAALELLRQRPDRGYSLADAVSFVVMRELTIDRAFTLDDDFSAEGFQVVPAG